MDKKIKFVMNEEIKWPQRCTKCGATKNMTMAKVQADTINSISPMLLIVSIKSRIMTLQYPICSQHKTLAWITGIVTEARPVTKLVRYCIYMLFVFAVAGLIGNLREHELPDLNFLHWDAFIWMSFMGIVGFSVITWSRRWVPLRVTKWDEGVVDIVFGDPQYAKDFAKLNSEQTNPALTKRLPWYNSKYWGAIFLGTIAILGLFVLAFPLLRSFVQWIALH